MKADMEQVRRVLEQAVRRICPGWLANQREDLVQAALLKVVRITQAEERETPTSSYLWRVAHSAVMDEIRRRRRSHEVDMEVDEATTPHRQPQSPHLPGELREVIRGGLAALDASRRSAVLLFLHGFSIKDSARTLGWTSKRVDNERYRGLAELRRFLEEKGYRP